MIRLDQFEFDLNALWTYYRHQHETHSQTFVAEYLRRTGGDELAQREDPGMSVLADRLSDKLLLMRERRDWYERRTRHGDRTCRVRQ